MTKNEITSKIEGWCKEGRVKYDIFTILEKDKGMMRRMEDSLDGYDLYPKIPDEFKNENSDW